MLIHRPIEDRMTEAGRVMADRLLTACPHFPGGELYVHDGTALPGPGLCALCLDAAGLMCARCWEAHEADCPAQLDRPCDICHQGVAETRQHGDIPVEEAAYEVRMPATEEEVGFLTGSVRLYGLAAMCERCSAHADLEDLGMSAN